MKSDKFTQIRRPEEVLNRMTERDGKIGGREIGEGPYEGEDRQETLAEKRVSVTVEFKIAFREIPPETALEMSPSRDPAKVLIDAALMGDVEIQGRRLRALLEDEEALRQFIACAVIDEVVAGGGGLLRKGLRVKSEEEALRPLTEALGGEVAEHYAVVGEETFAENIELLIFSTPVKCLGVRGRVVGMGERGIARPISIPLGGFSRRFGAVWCCLGRLHLDDLFIFIKLPATPAHAAGRGSRARTSAS